MHLEDGEMEFGNGEINGRRIGWGSARSMAQQLTCGGRYV